MQEQPIAIIGMACRLPGAENLVDYWRLLISGQSAIRELPASRLDRRLHFNPQKGSLAKTYTTIGGLTSDRTFDSAACPLPEDVIAQSDRAHLNFFEVAAQTCRHAGLDPYGLPSRQVGVYVGHTRGTVASGELALSTMVGHTARYLNEIEGFAELVSGDANTVVDQIVQGIRERFGHRDKRGGPFLDAHRVASLVSQGFGLDGPAMSINAACASSLIALSLGVKALQRGYLDMAIVGGASHCKFDSLVLFSQAQSASSTGSRPFDEEADGLVAAEGYVALLLKPLSRAIRDGDRIQAVIRGVGMSSDGRGKSLWAPRKEGQIEAIHRAYGSDVDVEGLQYIEAHATSTQIGDATEAAALADVLAKQLPPGKKIPIGSVKANIGHTLETAGMAGLLKVVLAMQHGEIPPAINLTRLNTRIPWDEVPFFVAQERMPWPAPAAGNPKRAAVNAFGIGGLNVHLVVDEYLPQCHDRSSDAAPTIPKGPSLAKHQVMVGTSEDAVAIVGAGAILPGAKTLADYWQLIDARQTAITEIPPSYWNSSLALLPGICQPWHSPINLGGVVSGFEYDWRKHRVPPKQIATADPLQFMLLDVVDQALRDAGLADDDRSWDRRKTGVIVGTEFLGEFAIQLQVGIRLPEFQETLSEALVRRGVPQEKILALINKYVKVFLRHMPALSDETGSFTSSTLASRITKTFDLMGGACAIDAGGASSAAALATCVDMLLTGHCDAMICAAGQRALGLANYERLALEGVLAKQPAATPLDAGATGIIPGEGACVVILKRLADAQRNGDRIHGIIRGIGVAQSNSIRDSVRAAVERSLSAANLSAERIGAIELAASGSPGIDSAEVAGTAAAHEAHGRNVPALISCISGQIGHTGGAAGLASLLRAAYEAKQVLAIPPTGIARPAEFIVDAKGLSLPVESQPIPTDENGRVFVGVNCIGGINQAYHIVLERGIPVGGTSKSKTPQTMAARAIQDKIEHKIIRLGAETREELAGMVTRTRANPASWFESGGAEFAATSAHRLAVVVDSPLALSERLAAFEKSSHDAASLAALQSHGIFFAELLPGERVTSKVAFLFPGQGSQYHGMLREVVSESPAARSAVQEMDRVLGALQYPCVEEILWTENGKLGHDVWWTQLSILLANTIVLSTLHEMGITPDCATGHSYGEFVALMAAGAWDFETCAQATYWRCKAVEKSEQSAGVMVSSTAPAEIVNDICSQVGGPAYLSNHNAPNQTVVAGEKNAVAKVTERLKQQGFQILNIPVPRPFHTPLMKETQRPLASALSELTITPPGVPFFSSVSNRYVAEPDEIRDNLVSQMTSPVRYVDLVQRLVKDGIGFLVEVGPDQVLTKLNCRIVNDPRVIALCTDNRKRGGLHLLLRVKACLEAHGVLDRQQSNQPRWFAGSIRKSPETQTQVASTPIVRTSFNEEGIRTEEQASISRDIVVDFDGLSVLKLSGTPFEMGFSQGRAQLGPIRTILRRYADLAGVESDALPSLDTSISRIQDFFTNAEIDEFRGIAAGAVVPFETVVAHHLLAYPDIELGGCSHFAITSSANSGTELLHAANEDLPLGLVMRDCLSRNVQVRAAQGEIPYVTFGLAGQAGGINGMNSRGLAISSSMLLDLPRREGTLKGQLHAVLVKRVLGTANDIPSALEIIRNTPRTGGWGMCISDARSDRLCYVEYDGPTVKIDSSPLRVIASNHSLLLDPIAKVPPHSYRRLARLQELFSEERDEPINLGRLKRSMRDRFDMARHRETAHPTMNTICRVDNQISIVMQPREGRLWVTPGPRAKNPDEYREIRMDKLLSEIAPAEARTDHGNRLHHDARQPQTKAIPTRIGSPQAGGDAKDNSAARQDLATPSFPSISAVDEEEYAATYGDSPKNGPADMSPGVGQRFVLRMIKSPLISANAGGALDGNAVILGNNELSQPLRREIEKSGKKAIVLPALADAQKVIAALEASWRHSPLPHLFLLSSWNSEENTCLDAEAWKRQCIRGATIPFLVTQRWFQLVEEAGLTTKASVLACTSLGGDFGISGRMHDVTGGAHSGLLKDLNFEIARQRGIGFRARIVDVGADENVETTAQNLIQEVLGENRDVEVALHNGSRYVLRQIIEPVSRLPRIEPSVGGTWIVTGGARGVTAIVARELGRRFGLKLHLLGSSAEPEIPGSWRKLSDEELSELRAVVCKEAAANGEVPIEAWRRVEKAFEIDRNLASFKAAGVQATYHACDVADRDALEKVLAEIRDRDGPITGVLHGAGFEKSVRFERKQPELVERTFRAKVGGAAALMELTRGDELRHFIAFGSTSGRFGSVGQADYCAANDMLAKLVSWYRTRNPRCRAVCFHWTAWDEVGMAMRPEIRTALQSRGIKFLPVEEGVDHVVNELLAGVPAAEVVVTDWERHLELYPPPEIGLDNRVTGSDLKSVHMPTKTWAWRPTNIPISTKNSASDADNSTSVRCATEPSDQEAALIKLHAPAYSNGDVCSRFVMKMVDAPLPADADQQGSIVGPVLVVGENECATQLVQRLARRNVVVHSLPISGGIDAALERLEVIWRDGPVPYLFILTGRERDASRIESHDAWHRRRERGVLLPYLICQKWTELVTKSVVADQATLIAVTGLGGDLGWQNSPAAPEGGALAGLLKAIHREFEIKEGAGIRVKVIDSPWDEPAESLADSIVREVASGSADIEVSYSHGHRRVAAAMESQVAALPQLDFSVGANWIVTGGARGVTAVVAQALASDLCPKLHLLGSSRLPDIEESWLNLDEDEKKSLKQKIVRQALADGKKPHEVWERWEKDIEIAQNLRRFSELGASCVYHQCDVSNRDELSRVLSGIRAQDGPIHGILHGAGFERACRFEKKQREFVERTISVKADSAWNLMELTRDDPLRWFVAFGSISGRFGGVGQTDYCVGNELLAKLIDRFRHDRPECRSTVIQWHSWDEVGMAVRPESKHIKTLLKFKYMPTREGCQHLLRELSAGLRDGEVVITDREYCRKFYPHTPIVRESGSELDNFPLIERLLAPATAGVFSAEVIFRPDSDRFLQQHLLKKRPILPLVIGVEAIAESAVQVIGNGKKLVSLENVEVESALKFFSNEPLATRIRTEKIGTKVRCLLESDFVNRQGKLLQKDRLHVRGVAIAGSPEENDHLSVKRQMPALEQIRSAGDYTYPDDLAIYHGPIYRALKAVQASGSEGWGWIVAPDPQELAPSRRGTWFYSPVVLDACFYACGVYMAMVGDRAIHLPQGLTKLRFGQVPKANQDCLIHLSCRARQERRGEFDFTVQTADGTIVLDVTGYHTLIIPLE